MGQNNNNNRNSGAPQRTYTNSSGVINQANPANGIEEMDFSIVSTLVTPLTIEMFNPLSSQTIIANTGINSYNPLAGSLLTVAGWPKGSLANQYLAGVVMGDLNLFVSAANPIVPPAASDNICYFDLNGNLIYQPGYVAGVLPAGNVIVSSTISGTSYRLFFEWCRTAIWDLTSIKAQYSEIAQTSSTYNFIDKNVVGTVTKNIVNPANAKSETNFNPLILTASVSQRMKKTTGMQYNVQAFTANAAMTILMNCYFTPLRYSASTKTAVRSTLNNAG
jgi:hypothetical protein